ncbi:MAG: cytochrome c3 family protein [Planctomycetota bacterium]
MILVAALAALFLLTSGCGAEPGEPKPATISATDQDSASAKLPPKGESEGCMECHFVRGWTPSDHARSTAPATEETVPDAVRNGETIRHGPGKTVFGRDGDHYTATVTGDTGEDQAYPVELVVGVYRMRMLIARLGDGRLQVLPGILDEAGDRWFDYTELLYGDPAAGPADAPRVLPGEVSFWTGADRSFDNRCARCHTSGYRPMTPEDGKSGPRSAWRNPGVDCEACHGEGEAHSERFRHPERAGGPDPLLKLEDLDRDRALGVCLVCHMEGEVVEHGFRPGDDVFEFIDPTLLDAGTRVDAEGRPRELIYEGLSFLVSRCATEGELRCTDCHDPHGREHRSMLKPDRGRLDALCIRCHEDQAADPLSHTHHAADGPARRCVSGHMPPVTIERGHGAVHDHSIGSPRPNTATGSRDACNGCHRPDRGNPEGAPRLDESEVLAAFKEWWPDAAPRSTLATAVEDGRRRDPGALPALFGLAVDTEAGSVARASAVRLIGGYPPAVAKELLALSGDADSMVRRAVMSGLRGLRSSAADAALMEGLGDPSPAVRSSAARAALAGWERVRANAELLGAVVRVLEEDTRRAPEDHLRWFRLGAARQLAGDVAGAIEAYERKLLLDPAAAHVRRQVETLRREQDDPVER